MDVMFLGQSVTIGRYIGRYHSRAAIIEAGTNFNILRYFIDNVEGGISNPNGASVIFDGSGVHIFALAYRYTSQYGWSTWLKWARSDSPISDDDMPPAAAPWQGWIRVGDFTPGDISISQYNDNEFSFYMIEPGLLPYWEGSTNQDLDIDTLKGGAAVPNILVVTGLRSYDGVWPVTYSGSTPILPHSGAYTNWMDSSNVTDPSYTLEGLGMTNTYVYSPLDIDDAKVIQDFEDDTARPGGGYDGDYGYRGEEWGIDPPLGLDALDTGIFDMYSPTKSQVQNLASFLWSSSFIDNVLKAWSEPMDSIISFGIVPIDLSSFTETTSNEVVIGGVGSGVQMYRLKQQKIVLDMGTVNVKLSNTNALDFEPFTQAQIYLPFIGFCPLKVNDVMSGTAHVVYHIDLLSGDCIAFVECKRDNASGMNWWNQKSVRYQYRGNLLISVPLCARDYSSFYKNLVLGGISAAGSAVSGNIGGAITGLISSATNALMDGPDVQRSGNYSGSVAGLMNRRPCLILSRAIQQLPAKYSEYIGYPCFNLYKLSKLHGFTMVEAVIDNTVSATDTEKTMIEDLLKGGIII